MVRNTGMGLINSLMNPGPFLFSIENVFSVSKNVDDENDFLGIAGQRKLYVFHSFN